MISSFTSIDWKYTGKVDVQQVWAQALALYRNGETWNLLADEVQMADEINTKYEYAEPLDAWLRELFTVDPERKDWWVSNPEIWKAIDWASLPRMVGNVTSNRLGKSWSRLGLTGESRRVDGRLERGWVGLEKKVSVTI